MSSTKELPPSEKLIVTFANLSLIDDPKNIIPILEATAACTIVKSGGREALDKAVKLMGEFYLEAQSCPSVSNNPLDNPPFSKPAQKSFSSIQSSYEDTLREINFHVDQEDQTRMLEVQRPCPGWCGAMDMMKQVSDEQNISQEKQLNCIECNQLFFKFLVRLVSEGRDYRTLEEMYKNNDPAMMSPGVWQYFLSVASWIDRKQVRHLSGATRKHYPAEIIQMPTTPYLDPISFIAIYEIPMGVLLRFLRDQDRRRLLKCEHCEKFSIVNQYRSTRRYCDPCSSKRSGMWDYSEEEKKQIRETSSEKKKIRKEEEQDQDPEKQEQIQIYMESGYTREDAEIIYNSNKSRSRDRN